MKKNVYFSYDLSPKIDKNLARKCKLVELLRYKFFYFCGLPVLGLSEFNMAVFRRDPCGVCCLVLTYSAVIYADYCIVNHVVIPTISER